MFAYLFLSFDTRSLSNISRKVIQYFLSASFQDVSKTRSINVSLEDYNRYVVYNFSFSWRDYSFSDDKQTKENELAQLCISYLMTEPLSMRNAFFIFTVYIYRLFSFFSLSFFCGEASFENSIAPLNKLAALLDP